MSSPTVMAELRAVQRGLQDPEMRGWYWHHGPHGVSKEKRERYLNDPLRVFKAELPERRYHEAHEREYQEQLKHGGREICPDCGERSVKKRDVFTLGYAGHPGAEISVYRSCEKCEWNEL